MIQAEHAASVHTNQNTSAPPVQDFAGALPNIIPADDHGVARFEAGAPEFIDLITSENNDFTTLGGGIMWLDSALR